MAMQAGARGRVWPSSVKATRQLRSVGEAAKQIGVSPSTVRNWIDKGYIRAAQLPSGHRRISQSEVDRLYGQIFHFGAPVEEEESQPKVRVSSVAPDEEWGP
jgi:excisionase family DNA binding protein